MEWWYSLCRHYIMNEQKRKTGRPPLPPDERKAEWYSFRITKAERKRLEGAAGTLFYHDLCLAVADVLESLPGDGDKEMFQLLIPIFLPEMINDFWEGRHIERAGGADE